MKVIFLSREGYQLPGARIRCYNFSKELSKYGVETEVLSYKDHLGAKDGQEEDLMEDTQRIWYNLKAFLKLSRNRHAILYIQRIHYHYLAPLLAHETFGNKLILDVDDWDLGYNPFKRLSYINLLKGIHLTKRIAGISKGCVASSEYLMEYLSRFNRNTVYIPTGVDTSLFYPHEKNLNLSPHLPAEYWTPREGFENSLHPRGKTAGYSGRWGDKKIIFSWIGTMFREDNVENLLFIIDCFSQLNRKYPEIQLQIVGTGPRVRTVVEIIHSRYPDADIQIVGWISPQEMPNYLAGIDIGLFPLIQDIKFNLSKSPTKLFEYMAMKKPTVSSNIGEISTVIKDGINGFLAVYNSKESFIEKMEDLVLNKDLRTRMGENALQTVKENYSLEAAGRRLYEFLSKI